MSKSKEYWQKRFELLLESQLDESEDYLKGLEEIYRYILDEIEKDVLKWYSRFAKNNEISLAEGRRLLNSDELREFHWDVNRYIEIGEQNAVNRSWMRQLENASSRVHISRLESLKLQLQQQVEVLYGQQIEGVERLMRETYQSAYYQTAFEIQRGFNVGFSMQALDNRQLQQVISKPWTTDGLTFSDKIWKNKNELVQALQTELTRSIVRGESPDRMISFIQKKMKTSKDNAARLVMTESAFFSSAAQKDTFNYLDVEQYEVVATLDGKTSSICQDLDGMVFKMSDYAVGITAPPFHPWCRTVTVPYFDDDFGSRIARGLDGKAYHVPSNMTYEEWLKSVKQDNRSLSIPHHKQAINVIPNLKNAKFIDQKLTKYALNKNHPSGGPKAVLFDDFLGYNENNWESLKENIITNMPESFATAKGDKGYGETFEVIQYLRGPSGRYAHVLSGWVIKEGTSFPTLTTAYIIDEKKAKKKLGGGLID
ncbi:minor capsid protein [Viridibacillus arvi]|uniref:minor capsid protein n=1 Tax=Viridibacillus arvi TaxID=263475 RepID=UPI003D2BBA0C